MSTLTLKIDIVPMAKQSARFAKRGRFMHSYQPKKITDWVKEARKQINEQLPSDWKLIQGVIKINKLTFAFPSLKSFSKKKLSLLSDGQIIYKPVKPDLDNLKKQIWDSCNKVVWKDDAQICVLNNVSKIFALKPYIYMEIEYGQE